MPSTVLILLLLSLAGPPGAEDQKPAAKPAPQKPAVTEGRMNAAAQRNENVQVNRIDNDAIKEANIRLGDNVTVVTEATVEANYFASEHGRAAAGGPILPAASAPAAWHGELFESHRNSIFNARTFFQVGPVKPSRRNAYGGRFSGPAGWLGDISGRASQNKVRGMVNGNVLVPLANERTSLATDPAVSALVSRFLAAYPEGLPNRPDFDPRALNTNAAQRIDETDAELRLDRATGEKGKLSISETLSRQRVDAFQLVAGQNPDNEIHSHRARLSYRYTASPATTWALGFAFQRTKSVLQSEPNAVGPRIRIGYQIEELGPDSMFPIDRAQNSFRYGASGAHRRGSHSLTFGGDFVRYQLNGIESNNQRGVFWFTNNFGRSAVENLRRGVPSLYEASVGEIARGFRNSAANVFFGDRWTVTPRLQIYYGLRYGLETAPSEANGLNTLPYDCDCNNFSPRFSIAYRLRDDWVMRTSYTASFGQILPVTYQQIRYNAPQVQYIQVQNPSLLNPLAGIDLSDPNVRTSPTYVSPDLVSPYVHQYGFSLERSVANRYILRAGYVGSRTMKLLNMFITNRAEPVAGIPLTTATVDQRRPDPRFYEIKHVVNGGIAYMDAAQFAIELPGYRGLAAGAAYTFGKALDEGSDYAYTAANKDSSNRSQWQYESFKDKKGLSNFDSTHALLVHYTYDIPRLASAGSWLRHVVNGWQASGVTLLKSGTPLTLYVGSDGPGFGNVDGGASDRPSIVDPAILGMTISHPNTSQKILSRERFAFIKPGERRGSLGRNTFRKAGIANFNAAVTKQWRWGGGDQRALLFRAEAYNLTNHAQFDEPQRNLSSPAFGKITNSLNDGRVLQIGLRLAL